MKRKKWIKNRFLVFSVLLLAAAGIFIFAAPAKAAPNQLDGTVYWDQNNNGVQDVGEPGMPGLIVRFGGNSAPSTVTDSNGDYVLTGVSGSATLEVFTGWFRSQCNSLNCAAGPGADNDFTVNNQFIQLTANGTTGGTFDVGLVPDWGGTYPVTTFNVARPVDLAARLTYTQGCNAGTAAERLCNPGDSVRIRTTLLNQGTGALSNPVFALQAPVGHTIDDSSWPTLSATNQAHPSANTIAVVQPFNSTLGYGVYRLNGTLPAGASSGMFVNIIVGAGAIGSPTPYATADPRDKQAIFQVLHMDQSGDPDSDYCLSGSLNYIYGSCALQPLGDHDKTLPSDHSDGASWNVTGTFVARADSAEIDAAVAGTPVDVCSGSQNAMANLSVSNTSLGDSALRNFEVSVTVPSGLSFNLADNPGWFIGGDGKPHTFINLSMLPGASQEIPITLAVNPGVTPADNGTPALQLEAEIIDYNLAITTLQPDGTNPFNDGSQSGVLAAFSDVTVTGESCPVSGGGGSGSLGGSGDSSGTLAAAGTNLITLAVAAIGMIVLAGLFKLRFKKVN